MAKNIDESEENINDENQEFNDIDENFGLPELDIEPVDKIEETTYSSTEDESEYSDTQEPSETYVDDSGYVSGTYADQAKESSSGGKVAGIIITVIIILASAGGSYYWFFMRPKQIAEEKAKQELLAKKEADKRKKEDYDKLISAGDDQFGEEQWSEAHSSYSQASALFPDEEYPKDQLAIVQGKIDEIEALNAKPKIGEIETISQATKRYYIIGSSSIDGDLAMDFAVKITKKGENVGIIEPYGKNKYFRVTLGNYDTWQDAENALSSFSEAYGNSIWILKY
ncbi:MAG: SPOR domain-containing protein [Cyclobacteriaceae bacterium]|nr:SPOR domain-containing protein [Cyclobacteriaceae bacterium]